MLKGFIKTIRTDNRSTCGHWRLLGNAENGESEVLRLMEQTRAYAQP